MQLPTPGPRYDQRDESATRDLLMRTDAQTLKRNLPAEIGDLTVTGDATVSGAAAVAGDASVAGAATVGAGLDVGGALTFTPDATHSIGAFAATRPLDVNAARWGVFWGGLQFAGVLSPAQITSDQNDYEPTGFLTSGYIRLTSDAARNITGFGRDAAAHVKVLANVGAFSITLKHESASSTANKRLNLKGAVDFVLVAGAAVLLAYDGTSDRWRVIGA